MARMHIVAAMALTALVSSPFAASFGAKVGLGYSMAGGDDADDLDFDGSFAWAVGGTIKYPINEKMAVIGDLMWSSKMLSATESDYNITTDEETSKDITLTANFIDLAILFGYEVAPKVTLSAGPVLSYFVSGDVDGEDLEDMATLPISLAVGADYAVTEQISVGLRYNLGLTTVFDDQEDYDEEADETYTIDAPDVHFSLIQVLASYSF